MGSKKWCDHRLNDDYKSEDLYISIIEQLPSIIVVSNINSFDNSRKEYLLQHVQDTHTFNSQLGYKVRLHIGAKTQIGMTESNVA